MPAADPKREDGAQETNGIYPRSPLGYPDRLLAPGQTYDSVTDTISSIVLTRKQPRSWVIGLMIAMAGVLMFFFSVTYLFLRGGWIWGVNISVAWGFALTNFVLWI